MSMPLTEPIKSLLKSAANRLTGSNRRQFMAEVTLELLDGSPTKAERLLGWGRETVRTGMMELKTGIECIDNFSGRGNKKTEEKNPQLEQAIREIVEPHTQADPDFKRSFSYIKITAKAVRQALMDEKGYTDKELPSERTLNTILNRLGYSLKRVEKTKPVKKTKEVDEIFANVHQVNKASDEDPESLRISIDTKAKVKVGDFSRGGKSRGKEVEKGLDHDVKPDDILVPFGVLVVMAGMLTIVFGRKTETTDFIVDCLELWWEENKSKYPHIKELVINLDNGPHLESHRTQFIKRMIEFSDNTGLKIHLVYYPPYHSKYNPIERCWGALEQYWNGTLLNSIEKTMEWAGNMTWRGLCPVIHFVKKVYDTGVSVTKKKLKKYLSRFKRSEKLPKWDVVIEPAVA